MTFNKRSRTFLWAGVAFASLLYVLHNFQSTGGISTTIFGIIIANFCILLGTQDKSMKFLAVNMLLIVALVIPWITASMELWNASIDAMIVGMILFMLREVLFFVKPDYKREFSLFG